MREQWMGKTVKEYQDKAAKDGKKPGAKEPAKGTVKESAVDNAKKIPQKRFAKSRFEEDFKDIDGSPHELTVTLTGTQPDIKVASKPTGVQHQIEDRRNAEKDKTNPRPLTTEQKKALTRAWNQHTELVRLSGEYLKADDQKKPVIEGKLQKLMDRLAANMVKGDAWSDTEILQPTKVIFSGSSGNKKVLANPLTKRPGNTVGSPATNVLPGWQKNVPTQTAGRGGTLTWRRVHLLSDKLHGPGNNPANLIPGDETTNGELRRGPERLAYERITRGETLTYESRVTGVDPNNSFFPASPKGVHVTVKKIAPGTTESVFDNDIRTRAAPTGAAGIEMTPSQLAVVDTYERLETQLGRKPTQTEVAEARRLKSQGSISDTISQIRKLVKDSQGSLTPELQRAVNVLGLQS
jgi:hypothetical protein